MWKMEAKFLTGSQTPIKIASIFYTFDPVICNFRQSEIAYAPLGLAANYE